MGQQCSDQWLNSGLNTAAPNTAAPLAVVGVLGGWQHAAVAGPSCFHAWCVRRNTPLQCYYTSAGDTPSQPTPATFGVNGLQQKNRFRVYGLWFRV
jgi:hypothetical protein